jgi:hypothetical protein
MIGAETQIGDGCRTLVGKPVLSPVLTISLHIPPVRLNQGKHYGRKLELHRPRDNRAVLPTRPRRGVAARAMGATRPAPGHQGQQWRGRRIVVSYGQAWQRRIGSTPSEQDDLLTRDLVIAGWAREMRVFGYVIIGDGSCLVSADDG